MEALTAESKPENLDASFEKANQILQEVYSVTISDELSYVRYITYGTFPCQNVTELIAPTGRPGIAPLRTCQGYY